MVRSISSTLMLVVSCLAVSVAAQTPPVQAPLEADTRDPSVAPNRVSLERILAFALEHSPELGVAMARVSRAHANIEAERPLMPADPVLDAGIALRQNRGRSGIDYQVGLSQELDLAGKRATRLRAERAELAFERSHLELTRWRIHQAVHALYHRAVVAKERVSAAERFVEFGARVLHVAEKRFQAGETSQLPVRLAETESAEARQALLAARSQYHATQLALAQVSGWPVARLPEPTEGLDLPRSLPPLAELTALARKADPALSAARARSRAALVQVDAAERTAWPNPTLGVRYARESDPWGADSHIIGGTLSFPLPVWRGAEPKSLRARAAFNEARAEAQRVERLLETEIRRAAQAVTASAERVRLFGKEIVPTSQQNLGLIERAFELGEIDMTQVLVARERFLRTQEAALDAYEDYYDALAHLETALGAELESNTSHTHGGAKSGQQHHDPEHDHEQETKSP